MERITNSITTFLVGLATALSLAFYVGGEELESQKYIHEYEPNLNIQYIGINDTISYTDRKNKLRKEPVTSNVVIYSIKSDSLYYLFNDTIKRNIVNFYFESEYLESYKTISFNNEHIPYESYVSGLYKFSNNRNIEKRPLSNNLIIITRDVQAGTSTIWIATKYGKNLRKVFEVEYDWGWEIDVKNRMIRLSRQVGLKIEIKNEKY